MQAAAQTPQATDPADLVVDRYIARLYRPRPRMAKTRLHPEQMLPLTPLSFHILLALARPVGDLGDELQQAVGLSGHRGDDDHHVVARSLGRDAAARHVLHPLGISDRGSAVLLDDQGHVGWFLLEQRVKVVRWPPRCQKLPERTGCTRPPVGI